MLHDAHLHHARAAALLRNDRADDYRREFAANHPDDDAGPGGARDCRLRQPSLLRLADDAPRRRALAARCRPQCTAGRRAGVRFTGGTRACHPPWSRNSTLERRVRRQRRTVPGPDIRSRTTPSSSGVMAACPLTSDCRKFSRRWPQHVVYIPAAHLLLAGGVPEHYDLAGDIDRLGLNGAVTVTGYLPTDEAVHRLHCRLRRRAEPAMAERSRDLRSMAALPGRRQADGHRRPGSHVGCPDARSPDLAAESPHWTGSPRELAISSAPCAVAIDILDEDHSLRLAMRRLGSDALLRSALGRAAQEYWQGAHSLEVMVSDYEELIRDAMQQPIPDIRAPRASHRQHGSNTGERPRAAWESRCQSMRARLPRDSPMIPQYYPQ